MSLLRLVLVCIACYLFASGPVSADDVERKLVVEEGQPYVITITTSKRPARYSTSLIYENRVDLIKACLERKIFVDKGLIYITDYYQAQDNFFRKVYQADIYELL